MTLSNLSSIQRQTYSFVREAQRLNPNKTNLKFWQKFLQHALGEYRHLLPNIQAARSVFDAVAQYHLAPAQASNREFTILEQIETAINESLTKLQAAGKAPEIAALNVIKSNLEVLIAAKDFRAYRQLSTLDHSTVTNDPSGTL